MVDGDTWQCTYWSTNSSAVVLAMIGNASAFDTIVCRGNIQQLDTTLTFSTSDVTFIFDALYWNTADVIGINITASRVRIIGQTLYRGATPTDKPMILINGGGAHNINIMQVYIEDGVAVKFVGDSYFTNVVINQILGCNIGVHFYATTGETIAHNVIQIGQINPASHACTGIKFEGNDTGIVARNMVFKTIFQSTTVADDVGFWNNGENTLEDCHTADLHADGKAIVNSGILQVIGGTFDTWDKITDTGTIKWSHVYFGGDDTWINTPEISSEASWIVFVDENSNTAMQHSNGTVTWRSTDSSAVINACIGNFTTTERHLFIKGGEYNLSSRLDILIDSAYEGMIIEGEGESTYLKFNVENNACINVTNTYGGAKLFTIKNLRIMSTLGSPPSGSVGIKLGGTQGYGWAVIENVFVRNLATGFHVVGPACMIEFNDVTTEYCTTGMNFETVSASGGASQLYVNNAYLLHGTDGIIFTGQSGAWSGYMSENVIITGGMIEDYTKAIHFPQSPTNGLCLTFKVDGMYFEDNDYDIVFNSTWGVESRSPTIKSCFFTSAGAGTSNIYINNIYKTITIEDSTFADHGQDYCIYDEGSSRVESILLKNIWSEGATIINDWTKVVAPNGWNTQFRTTNSGTATNSTATTFVFNHGLAGTPTGVWASFNTTTINGWAWTATSSQITITVSGSGLPAIMASYWKAEYVP